MNINTNYNSISTNNIYTNKGNNLLPNKFVTKSLDNNISFRASYTPIKGRMSVLKSILNDKFLKPELDAFIKEFNPIQYKTYQYDKYCENHITDLWRTLWYGSDGVEALMKDEIYEVSESACKKQADTLLKYKDKTDKLFKLLIADDKYGHPNIDSLDDRNLELLLSIFKDTPDKIDKLLIGHTDKILVENIIWKDDISRLGYYDNENVINLIQELKNHPELLDEILSPINKDTGETLLHNWCKAQNVEVLNCINDAYKNRPNALLDMYSIKNTFDKNLRGFERGNDGAFFEYKKSNKTPLDYLEPENLKQVIDNCNILAEIKR